MARQVTLLQLRTRVRQRANMENSQFISDAEMNDNINESLAELYDLLVAAYGEEYFRQAYTFSTASGTTDYALPSDYYKLLSIDINLSGTFALTARPYMEFERNQYKFYPTWTNGSPIYYRLHGANNAFPFGSISFIPTPVGAVTIGINYVPAPPKLYADSDVFDGIAGWEEYAVVDATIKCLQKEESDVSIPSGQKEALRQRIMGMAPSRDENAPERVHDVISEEFDSLCPWRSY